MLLKKILLLILIFSSSLFAVMEGGVSLTRFTPTERYNHLEPSLGFELYGLFEPPMSYFGIGGYLQYIPYDTRSFRVPFSQTFK